MLVLIAVDGSEHSELTARKVVELAAHIKDLRVRLVHAMPEPLNYQYHHGVVEDDAVVREKQLGRRLLDKEIKILEAAGLPTEWSVEIGDSAESIVRAANESGCDLIVLGSHGLGGFTSLLMGSVAMNVVQQSPVPVLLIK